MPPGSGVLENFDLRPSAIAPTSPAASNEPLGFVSMPILKCVLADMEGRWFGATLDSLGLAWHVHGRADLAYSPMRWDTCIAHCITISRTCITPRTVQESTLLRLRASSRNAGGRSGRVGSRRRTYVEVQAVGRRTRNSRIRDSRRLLEESPSL